MQYQILSLLLVQYRVQLLYLFVRLVLRVTVQLHLWMWNRVEVLWSRLKADWKALDAQCNYKRRHFV